MGKYEGTTGPGVFGAGQPPMMKQDAALVPTVSSLFVVPLLQAMVLPTIGAAGVLVAGVATIILLEWYALREAWVVLLAGSALVFLVILWLRYPKREKIMDDVMIKREIAEGRDLDGDGHIGRDPIPSRSGLAASRGEARRALLLRFVTTLYDAGTSYNALRAAGFRSDTDIRRWLALLASPSWGVLRLEKHGARESVMLLAKREQAVRMVESAVLPPEDD